MNCGLLHVLWLSIGVSGFFYGDLLSKISDILGRGGCVDARVYL